MKKISKKDIKFFYMISKMNLKTSELQKNIAKLGVLLTDISIDRVNGRM